MAVKSKDIQLKITIENNGEIKEFKTGINEIFLVIEREYINGDTINVYTESKGYYVISIDGGLPSNFVYSNGNLFSFLIPFGEKRDCYNPVSFEGNRHYIHVRVANDDEIKVRKNLCVNTLDHHDNLSLFPHSYANVETRGESVFASRNAIDGVIANSNHGKWPFTSWGINQDPKAAITIDFKRNVKIDEIAIYLRADFPHDAWWNQGTVTFSDGSKEVLEFEKTGEKQSFKIKERVVTSLVFDNLIKAEDPSPFPALTQIEAYGTEA